MATKKQQASFNNAITAILDRIAAVKTEENTISFRYEIKTEFGRVCVSLSQPEKSQVFSVYLRFRDYDENEEKLKAKGIEHYKWNVCEWEAKDAISAFKWKLEKLGLYETIPL